MRGREWWQEQVIYATFNISLLSSNTILFFLAYGEYDNADPTNSESNSNSLTPEETILASYQLAEIDFAFSTRHEIDMLAGKSDGQIDLYAIPVRQIPPLLLSQAFAVASSKYKKSAGWQNKEVWSTCSRFKAIQDS